jgi:hypothetical protein
MKFIMTILMSIPMIAVAGNPYVEFKNVVPFVDNYSQTSTSHLRLGYKLKNNLYVEGGVMSHGTSYEAGYKFSRGNWSIKGKWEGLNSNQRDTFNSKLQTEIRFTFGE